MRNRKIRNRKAISKLKQTVKVQRYFINCLQEYIDILKAEKNGMVTAKEYTELHKYADELEKKLEEAEN